MENKAKETKVKKAKKAKNFNKKAVLPIVIYVLAGLMAVYAIYTMYSTVVYIKELVDAGSVSVSDQLSDVVSYFVSTTLPPVFYAITTWAIGYGVAKLRKIEDLLKAGK